MSVSLDTTRDAAAALSAALVVGVAALAPRRRHPVLATVWSVVLVAVALAWLALNGASEGPVLVSLDRQHGVVLTDLLAILPVLLAATLLWHHGVVARLLDALPGRRRRPAGAVADRSVTRRRRP